MSKMLRNKKGQGLVEYGLIVAGVALICAAAVSVFGHKTSELITVLFQLNFSNRKPRFVVGTKHDPTFGRVDSRAVICAPRVNRVHGQALNTGESTGRTNLVSGSRDVGGLLTGLGQYPRFENARDPRLDLCRDRRGGCAGFGDGLA